MAQAIESFLGPLAHTPLGTSRQLEANLTVLAEQRGLTGPGRLLSLARRLSAGLGDDRDLHVLLGDNPPEICRKRLGELGDAGIHPGTAVNNVRLTEVMDLVDEYVGEVVRYFEANRPEC
jgi:hypothetical protein